MKLWQDFNRFQRLFLVLKQWDERFLMLMVIFGVLFIVTLSFPVFLHDVLGIGSLSPDALDPIIILSAVLMHSFSFLSLSSTFTSTASLYNSSHFTFLKPEERENEFLKLIKRHDLLDHYTVSFYRERLNTDGTKILLLVKFYIPCAKKLTMINHHFMVGDMSAFTDDEKRVIRGNNNTKEEKMKVLNKLESILIMESI